MEGNMTRIYTRTGDDGTTGLIGGGRVPKDAPVIEAVGTVDELNALLGIVRGYELPGTFDRLLQLVQEQLFIVGAELVTPDGINREGKSIGDDEIRQLEAEIDSCENGLPPLRKFILPGGSIVGAHLHYARAVARRLERRCVALTGTGRLTPELLRYVNRLSDLFFVLARYVNRLQSTAEKNSDC
jgi:cob(I)alamin adenosyltransferase